MNIDLGVIRKGLAGCHRDTCIAWLEGKKIEYKVKDSATDGWAHHVRPNWHENFEYRVHDPEQWRKDYMAEQDAEQKFEILWPSGHWAPGVFSFCNAKEKYRRVQPEPVNTEELGKAEEPKPIKDEEHVIEVKTADGHKYDIWVKAVSIKLMTAQEAST